MTLTIKSKKHLLQQFLFFVWVDKGKKGIRQFLKPLCRIRHHTQVMKDKTDLSLQVSAKAAFARLDYYCSYSSVTHLGHVTNTQHGVGMAASRQRDGHAEGGGRARGSIKAERSR